MLVKSNAVLLLVNLINFVNCIMLDVKRIERYFEVSKCFDYISDDVRGCKKSPVFDIEDLADDPLTGRETEGYKRLICCRIWDWLDCVTESAEENCYAKDYDYLKNYPHNFNIIRAYCIDYPYGSYRCWEFPLWAVILCCLAFLFTVCLTVVAFFYWRRKKVDYY